MADFLFIAVRALFAESDRSGHCDQTEGRQHGQPYDERFGRPDER